MPLALLALEGRPRDIIIFRQAARLATFAVLPLIPGGADGVTKLLVVGAEELILRTTFAADAFPGEGLHCGALAALVALKEVWPVALGGRLEFLPLMLTSVYGAVAVVALTAYSARRLLAAGRARNAGDWEASVVAPSPRRPRTKQPRSLLKTICSLLGSRDED